MREPTLIAATIGTAVAALRFRDDFRADRYDLHRVLSQVGISDGDCATTLRRTDRTNYDVDQVFLPLWSTP